MATSHSISSTLDGWFKQVYANNEIDLTTGLTWVMDNVPFKKEKKLGKVFSKPVVLANENGITQGLYTDGETALNNVATSVTDEAQVNAVWFINQSSIPKHLLERATAAGPAAYGELGGQVLKKLGNGLAHRLEVNMRYDGLGLGILESDPGDQSTSYTLTFTKASWAPHIWKDCIGAEVDVVPDDSGVPHASNKRNTAACTITAVSMSARTITVSCTADELDAATTGDHVVWRNSQGKTMTGIASILSNSGSLFGINGATYPQWAGNAVAAGSAVMTYELIDEAVVRCIEKGLDTDQVQLLVNPHSFKDLREGVLSQFRFNSNDVKQGARRLSFACGGVEVEVVADGYCKRGEAHLAPFKKHFMRIGTKEMELMKHSTGSYLHPRESYNSYLVKAYAEQAIFCDAPGMGARITGIVDSTSA